MESDSDEELDPHRDSANGGGNDRQLGRAMSNRTASDVVHDDGGGGSDESKTTARDFKDKLRGPGSFSGGRGSSWTSTVPVPASDIPLNSNKSRIMSRAPSTRVGSSFDSDPMIQADISAMADARCPSLLRNPSRPMERGSGRIDFDGPMKRLQREEEEEEEEEEEDSYAGDADAAEGGGEEKGPVRMSLMSLLAETDEDGIGYGMDDDDEEEDDEDEGGVEYNNCCICMVRHKGTAFEPCGHSFLQVVLAGDVGARRELPPLQ